MAYFVLTYGYHDTPLRAERRPDHMDHLAKLEEAGSVVLAVVSFRLVENPARHSSWASAFPQRSLVLGASLLAVTALVAERERGIHRHRQKRVDHGTTSR